MGCSMVFFVVCPFALLLVGAPIRLSARRGRDQSSWRHALKREIEGQEGAFPRTTELEKPPSSLFEFLRLGLPLAESLRRHRA